MFVVATYDLQEGPKASFGPLRRTREEALQDAREVLRSEIASADEWVDDTEIDVREGWVAFMGSTLEIDVVDLGEVRVG